MYHSVQVLMVGLARGHGVTSAWQSGIGHTKPGLRLLTDPIVVSGSSMHVVRWNCGRIQRGCPFGHDCRDTTPHLGTSLR